MKSWRLLASRDASVGEWLSVEERDYELPDGSRVDGFSVVTLADVSLVIPFVEDRVVLAQQFKPGSGEVTLEFPGGRKEEEGENMEEVAKRELSEETGYVAENLEYLGETVTFPTKATERISHYLSRITWKTEKTLMDEFERIEVQLVEANRIDEMIASGVINTGPSITSWMLMKLKLGEWWK